MEAVELAFVMREEWEWDADLQDGRIYKDSLGYGMTRRDTDLFDV